MMMNSSKLLLVSLFVASLEASCMAFSASAPQKAERLTTALYMEPPNARRSFVQSSVLALVAGALPTVASADDVKVGGSVQFGDESIMSQLADKICNYNRHFAEMGGYFSRTSFEEQVMSAKGPITFYDSVTGKPLFVAPLNRSPEQFVRESQIHGWPSFRDEEVVWENVRVLRNSGETVSVDGTHLGHNLPDKSGNRYCINLVSVAGQPKNA
ncbi:expressed unknown protein [Seminavis robusta]|uniref:Peptide-methionine (R)-S-oxide reductase n=1 Tax=Seminavis robusta TaxID=568900 RepID=A0A9N8F0U9_9STRA|nr:expressed unknown protein [Seminavis robusta]|eukprot:Sro2516_g329960.1 n/a (213) ;mRNA; r:10105-11120